MEYKELKKLVNDSYDNLSKEDKRCADLESLFVILPILIIFIILSITIGLQVFFVLKDLIILIVDAVCYLSIIIMFYQIVYFERVLTISKKKKDINIVKIVLKKRLLLLIITTLVLIITNIIRILI